MSRLWGDVVMVEKCGSFVLVSLKDTYLSFKQGK